MTTQDRKARTLQDLINQMQEDADRFVNTWSNVGDAMLRYQDNQKSLLGELAKIFSNELQDQPVYSEHPGVAGMGPTAPIGPTSAYAQPGPQQGTYQPYPTTYYVPKDMRDPRGGVANYQNAGYYPPPDQGYPPQPYQEQQALERHAREAESNISQVIKNLRRQGGGHE